MQLVPPRRHKHTLTSSYDDRNVVKLLYLHTYRIHWFRAFIVESVSECRYLSHDPLWWRDRLSHDPLWWHKWHYIVHHEVSNKMSKQQASVRPDARSLCPRLTHTYRALAWRLRSIYDLLTTTYAIHCDHRYEHIYVSADRKWKLTTGQSRYHSLLSVPTTVYLTPSHVDSLKPLVMDIC